MQSREASAPHIREQREWLDHEMMSFALSVFLTHFPEFRGTEIAERSGPMTVAGFRSYPDFPDPLGVIDPNAVQALDQNLKDLVLNALPPLSCDA